MKQISSRHDRALRLLALAVLAAAFFLPALARADSTAISYDGLANDYGSAANGALAFRLPTATTNTEGDQVYAYSAINPISPASSHYTGPAFYGAAWISSTSPSAFDSFNRDRIDSSTGDLSTSYLIELGMLTHSSGASAATTSGASFIAFQTGAGTYGVNAGSTLSLQMGTSNDATTRFAIEAGGQWYISQFTMADNAQDNFTFSLSLANSLWAAWDPNGGPGGRLADAASTFSILGSSLAGIQAAGYFTTLSADTANQYTDVTGFSATLATQAVPEPSTVAMLSLGGAVLFVMAAGRRRALFHPKR